MTTVLIRELPPVPPSRARQVAPRPTSTDSIRGWLHGHRDGLIGYAVPVILTMLVVGGWFRPGRFVASGDVAPFVRDNLVHEWWSIWSHQTSGAGATSYEPGRAAEVVILWAAHLVGLSDAAAQCAQFMLCLALAAFGSAFFASAWLRRPWVVAAVGLAGAFNAFQLVNVPNLLPAVAIGVAGTVGGLLVRSARGERTPMLRLVAAALPLSYLSLNPPLLVVVLVWGFAVACAGRLLAGPGGTRAAWGLVLRAGPWALLVSAWWLVPFVVANLAPAGIAFTAQTDVRAWAWSQVRNSIANVLTLNSHWGWTHPEYFPYAPAMDEAPVSWGRWLLPGLALVGIARWRWHRSRAVLTLGPLLVVLVFVGKGLHPPLTGANDWLFQHVPGMWLLREPMSKVGPLLVLVETTLAGFALESLLSRPPLLGRWRPAFRAVIALSVVGALAYPWPLWTGAVVSSGGDGLPDAHVAIPRAWHTTADRVNRDGGPGSVLVLPLDPYYQVTTSWGYHGVDAIPQQLFDRSVLQLLPGGYYSPTAGVQALMTSASDSLLRGDFAGARRRLEALGVSTVVVRRDLVRGLTDLPFADPAALARGAGSMAAVHLIAQTSVASAWRLDHVPGRVSAVGSLLDTPAGTASQVSAAVADLSEDAALTTGSTTSDGVSWQARDGQDQEVVSLAAAGPYDLTTRSATGSYFRLAVEHLSRSRYRVVLSPAASVALDGEAIAHQEPLELPVTTAPPVALAVDGVAQAVTDGMLVRLPDTAHLSLLTAAGAASSEGSPAGQGDCANSRNSQARGLAIAALPSNRVDLKSQAHTACVWWNVGQGRSAGPVLVSVTGQQVQGPLPRVCLWQAAASTCVPPVETSRNGATTVWTFVDLTAQAGSDQLFAYADGVPSGTHAVFEAPTVRHLLGAADLQAQTAAVPVHLKELPAGAHRIAVRNQLPDEPLLPLSAVEDCNTAVGSATAALAAVPIDGGIELHAAADSACAWTEPLDAGVAPQYRISVAYRTVAGQPARVCLWEVGPDRCADLPALAGGAQWHELDEEVVPDPGTRSVRLYVYADGSGSVPTVTQYRDLALRPSDPLVVSLSRVTTVRPPAITSACSAPRCTVQIRGAGGSFVLRLADSFAAGWQLRGLPADWTAEHVEVDGYANGWRINGRGNAVLELTYTPQRIVTVAQRVSAGVAAALLLVTAMALVRRRKGRWLWRWHRSARLRRIVLQHRIPRRTSTEPRWQNG